jgi:hypothetical protein
MLIRILALSNMCVSDLKASYRIGTLVKVGIVIPQINLIIEHTWLIHNLLMCSYTHLEKDSVIRVLIKK